MGSKNSYKEPTLLPRLSLEKKILQILLQKNQYLQKSGIDAEMPHKVRMYPYMNNLSKKVFKALL
jgi:hypothetical protein